MATIRANPSSRTSRTTPRPSTWPWTMWPPRRSAGRSGSSRLTVLSGSRAPSEERRSVSCITSAPKSSAPHIPTAVRQTPLTAIESPSLSSPASGEETLSRTPSRVSSTRCTVPRSWTRPVNTSPLPQPGTHEQIVADPVAIQCERAHGVGDELHAAALERVARLAPADDQGREEQPRLVDLPGVEERAGEVRAALEQDRGHVAVAELLERRADAGVLVLAGGDEHLRARRLECAGLLARRGARDHDGQRDLRGRLDELAGEREPRERVEHHAARLAMHAIDARGQLRVVGQRRSDADRDRVDRRAPAVREPAAVLARDPLRVARRGRDLAVERHRGLEQHPRPPGPRVLAERLVAEPRAGRQLTVGDDDLDALVAQDPEAAARGLLGRVVGGDDDARDPRLEDRVRARRRPPVGAARLERDVQRRAAGVGGAARVEARAPGVRRALRGETPRPGPSPRRPRRPPREGV